MPTPFEPQGEQALKNEDSKERIKWLPYLFRGISKSKLDFSLQHPVGTTRPDMKTFFGQWSETLGQACSYAISPQHEEDRSYGNLQYPGAVMIAQKASIPDFDTWQCHNENLKHPEMFREYDSKRNPALSDASIIFVSQEDYESLLPDISENQKHLFVTYSGEEVNWYEHNLHMGVFLLESQVIDYLKSQDPNFDPPLTEIGSSEDDELIHLEFQLFQAIRGFSREQISAAYRHYQDIIIVAFNDKDKSDQASIKRMTAELKSKLKQDPFISQIQELVGIAFFLSGNAELL